MANARTLSMARLTGGRRPFTCRAASLAWTAAVPATCLALLIATGTASAQSDQLYTASPQQLAAVKVVIAQQAAWNKGDLDGFLHFYRDAPDTEALLGSAARGTAELHTAFHQNYPTREAMGTIEYSEFDARTLGEDHTLVVARYHLARSRKAGGDADGSLTEVLQKEGTGWQVIFSETN